MAEVHNNYPGALRTLGIGVAMVAAMLLVHGRYPSLLSFAELRAFDLRMNARGTRNPHGEVVIVAVDDKSIVELGRWPWPRTVFARLTDALKSYNVAVVGFDMVFSERDNMDVEREKIVGGLKHGGLSANSPAAASSLSNDQAFADAIKTQGNTIVGYPLEVSTGAGWGGKITPGFVTRVVAPAPLVYSRVEIPAQAPPPPVIEAVAYLPNLPAINSAARGTAFFDTPSDADAVFRSELMVIRFGNRYCVPLSVAIVSAYANGAPTVLTLADYGVSGVTIGPLRIPVDEQGRMLVNFRGPAHTFPYYSVADVIGHRVVAKALANKIVLVGASALGLGDRLSSPMGAEFPGVELHANAIDNILTGDFIQRSQVTAGLELLAATVMVIAVSAAVAFLGPSMSLAVVAALIASYFGLAQYLLIADGILIGIIFPIVTTFIAYALLTSYRHVVCERERRLLRHALGEH